MITVVCGLEIINCRHVCHENSRLIKIQGILHLEWSRLFDLLRGGKLVLTVSHRWSWTGQSSPTLRAWKLRLDRHDVFDKSFLVDAAIGVLLACQQRFYLFLLHLLVSFHFFFFYNIVTRPRWEEAHHMPETLLFRHFSYQNHENCELLFFTNSHLQILCYAKGII